MIEVTKDLEGKVVKFKDKIAKVRNVYKDGAFTYKYFDSDGRCRYGGTDINPKVEQIITEDIWNISFDLVIAPEDLKMSNLPDGYYKVYAYPCFYYFKVKDNSVTALKTANNYYTDIGSLDGINEYTGLLKYNLEKCSENEVMWLQACERSGKNLFHPDFLIGNVFETKGQHYPYIKKVTGISSQGEYLIGPAIENGNDPSEGVACYEEFYAENSKRITDPEILAKFEEGKQEEKQKIMEVTEKTDFEKLEKGFWKLPSYFPDYDLFFEKISDDEVVYLVESFIDCDSTKEWTCHRFEPTNDMAHCVENCQKHSPEPCSEEEIEWLKLCKQTKSAIPKPEYWKGKVFEVKQKYGNDYYMKVVEIQDMQNLKADWRFCDERLVKRAKRTLWSEVTSMKLITDENIINSLEADTPNNDTPSTISSIDAATKEELAETKAELAEIKQKFNELSEQVQFLIDNPATISATPKGFYFTNHRGDICNSGPWITRIDPVENGFEVVASDFSSQKFQFSPLTPPEPESIMDETEKTTVWANLKRKLLG